MPGPIVYVDRSEVVPGRRVELEQRIHGLATFVERNEPRIVAYAVYFDEPGNRMTVIHVHHDSASLASHFEIAGPAFGEFRELVRMSSIDIYGRPQAEVLRSIRAKAADLGGGSVTVYEHQAGFLRIPASM